MAVQSACEVGNVMSPLEQYRALARYNRWMNRRLYAAVGQLDDDERRRDRGAFFGSIHATLNHLLLADRIWMLRLTDGDERYVSRDASGERIEVRSLRDELYGDFVRLLGERERTDEDLLAFTYTLDDAALSRTLTYRTTAGASQSHPTWWALSHLFNHQTHHRGQITTLLSQRGIDPGATDLLAMLREEALPSR